MVKLSKILSEGRSSPISFEKAVEIAKINNPNGISYTEIYRGVEKLSDDFYYIQPSLYIRKSSHTDNKTNYYTVLLDNLPSWKEYPKRSKSIVCSNSNMVAADYGNVYNVIPKEGSKIGISPSYDIWHSFSTLSKLRLHLNNFNHIIDKYVSRYQLIMSKKINKDNYIDLMEVLKYIIPNKQNFEFDESDIDILISECVSHSYNDMYKFIDNILLNPKKNGFSIKIYDSYFKIEGSDYREMWIEDDSILVHNNALYTFYNSIGTKND